MNHNECWCKCKELDDLEILVRMIKFGSLVNVKVKEDVKLKNN